MAITEVIHYKDFEPKSNSHIFIDNSILLYAFAPIGNYNEKLQQSVTRFLQSAKTIGSSFYITSLVISEFQNKILKDFFEDFKYKNSHQKSDISLKKDYRPSETYKEDIKILTSATNNAIKFCDRFPDDFQQIDMKTILENTNYCDYNDAYFIELANRKDWMIVTRDRDILDSPYRKTKAISFL